MTGPDDKQTPWYEQAFGADYLARYAHRNAEEAELAVKLVLSHVQNVEGERPLWRAAFRSSPPVRHFDLACGAGRHLAVFQQAGLCATGGDLSLPLLEKARGNQLAVMQLDMRYIPLQTGSVDLVTNFFTAFGYFDRDEENYSVFDEVARVLKPGGWFAFDFLNGPLVTRELRNLAQPVVQEQINGQLWTIRKGLSADGLRAEKIQTPVNAAENGQAIRESVRLFAPSDIKPALTKRKLIPVHEFGNYQGEDYSAQSSPRYILICQRR